MGLARQIRPAQVFKAKTLDMHTSLLPWLPPISQAPPWHQVIVTTPPAENLIRKITPRHKAPNQKLTKPKHLYRPQIIAYREDALRRDFFKDHPWELARPRVIVEGDGKDYQHRDWSTGLRQPGLPLCGESVVQRQLWLMENEEITKRKAYDLVRREFYRLRQEEEVERRVTLEEAKHVGAYFGKTRMDIGMQLEDLEYERWKVYAGKKAAAMEAAEGANVETFGAEEVAAAEEEDATDWAGDGEKAAGERPAQRGGL